MADSHISVFDIGIELRARVYHDLTNASYTYLFMRDPNRNMNTLTADVVDLTEGVIRYISKDGDFDLPGTYKIQANVIFNDGSQKTGSVHSFEVHGLFE